MSHVRSNGFKIVTFDLVVAKAMASVFELGVSGRCLHEDIL